MVRDLELDSDVISADIFCYPGARICTLTDKIKHSDIDTSGVHAVVLHVGTNNLSSSVWDIDRQSYVDLYNTVRGKYPEAKILFCAILPRWDFDCVHEQSVYYNLHLHVLSTKLFNCSFIDLCDYYIRNDKYYCWDGLHLNKEGKWTFALELSLAIEKRFKPKEISNSRIPVELKRLYTPRIKRRRKKESGKSDKDSTVEESEGEETSAKDSKKNDGGASNEGQKHEEKVSVKDSNVENEEGASKHGPMCQGEKASTKYPKDANGRCVTKKHQTNNKGKAAFRKRLRRKRRKRTIKVDREGFITPARMAPPPKPPEFLTSSTQPLQGVHMPYVHISSSKVDPGNHRHDPFLPRTSSAYVTKKKRGKQKRRRIHAQKRHRQRKRVCFYSYFFLELTFLILIFRT